MTTEGETNFGAALLSLILRSIYDSWILNHKKKTFNYKVEKTKGTGTEWNFRDSSAINKLGW